MAWMLNKWNLKILFVSKIMVVKCAENDERVIPSSKRNEQLLIPEHAINHSSHLFHKNALPFFAEKFQLLVLGVSENLPVGSLLRTSLVLLQHRGSPVDRFDVQWMMVMVVKMVVLLVVSTHLKNITQIGNLPQVGVKFRNMWNHHLVGNMVVNVMMNVINIGDCWLSWSCDESQSCITVFAFLSKTPSN